MTLALVLVVAVQLEWALVLVPEAAVADKEVFHGSYATKMSFTITLSCVHDASSLAQCSFTCVRNVFGHFSVYATANVKCSCLFSGNTSHLIVFLFL